MTNLGNARFSDAKINSGIGELHVYFCGDLLDDVFADIDLNIGETSIVVPDNVGTKMKIRRLLMFNPDFHYTRFRKSGSTYYSGNFNECRKKLHLNVSSGIGEVDIRIK